MVIQYEHAKLDTSEFGGVVLHGGFSIYTLNFLEKVGIEVLHSHLFATGSFSNLSISLHFYLLTELMVRFVQNVHILHLCVYLPSEHLRRPKSSFWVCNSSYHIFRNDHCILLCLSPHSVTSRADIFQQQKRICTFI